MSAALPSWLVLPICGGATAGALVAYVGMAAALQLRPLVGALVGDLAKLERPGLSATRGLILASYGEMACGLMVWAGGAGNSGSGSAGSEAVMFSAAGAADPALAIVGLASAATGMCLQRWAVRTMSSSAASKSNEKGGGVVVLSSKQDHSFENLVRHGPYAFVRHPLSVCVCVCVCV